MALTKNQIQYYRSLKRKKFRQKYNKFPVEGDKIVREVLTFRPSAIRAIMALPEWLESMEDELQAFEQMVFPVSEKELQQLSAMPSPNKVIAYLEYWEQAWVPDLWKRQYCFYLDGVQDPGNVGTLMRISDWFGMPCIFGSLDAADFFQPKVIQASMGAFLKVGSLRLELGALMEALETPRVLGAAMEGKNVFEHQWPSSGLIILGREGSGIRPEAQSFVTDRISIPGSGHAESLNAAIAGGILAAQLIHGQGTIGT